MGLEKTLYLNEILVELKRGDEESYFPCNIKNCPPEIAEKIDSSDEELVLIQVFPVRNQSYKWTNRHLPNSYHKMAPLEDNYSIDEAMVPYYGGHSSCC